MRTLAEIQADVKIALNKGEIHTLTSFAEEMKLFDTPEAFAAVATCEGIILNHRGAYPQALEQYAKAQALNEQLNDRPGLAGTLNNIANVLRTTGAYPEALENYEKSLALYEELADDEGIARITGNIGLLFAETDRYPEALEYYAKALALHESIHDLAGQARVTSNTGNVYVETESYDAALRYYKRALELYKELGNQSSRVRIMCNIALALTKQERFDLVRSKLGELEELNIEEPGVRIVRYAVRSQMQQHDGDLDAAEQSYLQALAEAQEHGLRSHEADLRKSLRNLALKRNDLPAYVEHNAEHIRIEEEIRGKGAALKIAMQSKEKELRKEREEREREKALLYSTLPKEIADRMLKREDVTGDFHENASVLFLDVVGFTNFSHAMSPKDVIELLKRVFSVCDAACENWGITKIKTIGDSYMAVTNIHKP